MARTLEVRYLSGVSLTIEVVARGTNVITETITMTELSVAKTVYTGTIATAGAGDYELMLKIGANYVATDNVRIEATDGVTYRPDLTGTSVIAIQADLPTRPTKNVALTAFPFLMVSSTDHFTPQTGLTIGATRRLDGGAFGACANTATEIGNGWYTIDLAAADMNGTTIALRFTGNGADDRNIVVVTAPT